MSSQADISEMFESRRERSSSANSIISIPSENGKDCRLYETMNLRSLIKAKDELDISAFDRTRLFNPRKQRSCHKRAEPVSEEHRKKESSKNSREYTKRNRDEIITCRALFNKIHALKCRFEQILFELKSDTVEKYVKSAIQDLMTMLEKYSNFGPDMKQRFGIPDAEIFLDIPAKMKYDTKVIFLPLEDEKKVVNEAPLHRNQINQSASLSAHHNQDHEKKQSREPNGNCGDSRLGQENSSNRNDLRTNKSRMDNREQRTPIDSRPISRSHQESEHPEDDNNPRNEPQNVEYHTDYDVNSWVRQNQERTSFSDVGDVFYDNEYEVMGNTSSQESGFQESANRPSIDNGVSPANGVNSRDDGKTENVQSREPIVNDSRGSKTEEVHTQQPFVENKPKPQLKFGHGFGINHYPDTRLPQKSPYARGTETEHPKSSNSTYHSEKNRNNTHFQNGRLMDQNRATAPDSRRTPERAHAIHNESVTVDRTNRYSSPEYGPSLLNESRIQSSPSNRSLTPKPLLDHQVYNGDNVQGSTSQPNWQCTQNGTKHSSFLQHTGFPNAETISSSESVDYMKNNSKNTDREKSQQNDPFSFSREDLMTIKTNSTYPPRVIRTITSNIGKLAKANHEPKYTFNRFAKEFVPATLKNNVESFAIANKTSTSTSSSFTPNAKAETLVSIEIQTDPKKVIATESQTDTDVRFEMYKNELISAKRELEIANGEREIAQLNCNNKQAKINLLEAQMEQLNLILKQKDSIIKAKNEETSLLNQTLAVKETLLTQKQNIIDANDATLQKMRELPAVEKASSLDDVLKFLEAENEKIVSSKLLISEKLQWSGKWAPETVSKVVDQNEYVVGHVEGHTEHSSVTEDLKTSKLEELSNDNAIKCKPLEEKISNLESESIIGNSHRSTTEYQTADHGEDTHEKLDKLLTTAADAESDVTAVN